jgi:ABC-type glycerol-3-phosphate transport system substrate-binding protein
MKNAFKFGFLALAISLSVAACNSEKKGESTDTTLTDSSAVVTDVDTTVSDSTVKDTTVKTTTTTVDTVKH